MFLIKFIAVDVKRFTICRGSIDVRCRQQINAKAHRTLSHADYRTKRIATTEGGKNRSKLVQKIAMRRSLYITAKINSVCFSFDLLRTAKFIR